MADANATTISDFLLGKGLTREQVAGVLGNLKIESNYNPTAYNSREDAIGIAQWQGGRRTRLQAYAAQVGGKETDLSVQLGFLWHELTGSEINAMHALAITTSPADAATAFDQYYERSSGAARTARITAAQAVYPTIGPGAGDTGFTTSGGGQAFRGQAGALTNDPNIPQPGIWGGIQAGADHLDDVSRNPIGAIADTVAGWVTPLIYKAGFTFAGAALVIGGLIVAAKPAAQKAVSLAADLK